MTGTSAITLSGLTGNHARAIEPMLAATRAYEAMNPQVTIRWETRPLQDFESQPLSEVANEHDLMIIDHAHLGQALRENLLLDFNTADRRPEILQIAAQSVSSTWQAYSMSHGQWALPLDASTAVASYRADRLDSPPQNWQALIELAADRRVSMPLRAPHAFLAFLWLARNRRLSVATDAERLMSDEDITLVLEQLAELTGHLRKDCFDMDPINVYEAMAQTDASTVYCPHGYGYITYSRPGFCEHELTFTDVPDATGGGVSGTVIGGTGIAVSALRPHRQAAVDFALWVAGAECQSRHWIDNGGQPAIASVWEDADCNARCNGFMANTRATLDAAWIRPRYAGYPVFQGLASHTISDYLQGRLSLPHCVQALQKLYRKSRLPALARPGPVVTA